MVTSSNDVPHEYPTDTDRGVLDGPQQEHILVLGDRSVINQGVTSNELSVAAHLAREHQRSTRKGACWLVLPVPQNVAANAPQTLEQNQDLITGTDLFVVMIGHTDALALTPAGEWERHLTATLSAAREMLPRDARVVLAEIPRLEAPTWWGRLGRHERHRRRLNRIIQRHTGTGSATRTMARLAALPAAASIGSPARERFAARYAQWAQAITAALATPDHT
ncbi:SGNH/GDSL hydrolase family protein [Frondihabitans cladoniiphilus]|uniref:GDSL-like lipase/acylhydrolase family protein n=1 Tax=Frondihabitans cladoniiphilus TaxID=715785 RepID=A0ABP8W771_9MICO